MYDNATESLIIASTFEQHCFYVPDQPYLFVQTWQHIRMRCQFCLFMQVGFAILGFISGSVGLRGTFAPQGDNKDTVKVHHL